MTKIKNAMMLPQIFYGLHFAEGPAEYHPPKPDKPFKVLIKENACKLMDATFAGKPLYVNHVDEIDLKNLESTADGYVIESFFNKPDGKHWAKFIVVTEAGHGAIRNGWTLSNAYIMKQSGPGGKYHGMDYDKEILTAEYEHLAIVPDPRYSESIILTPEQFKEYNVIKETQLESLKNSISKGVTIMLDFFKKETVKNSNELENLLVVLPKSKLEINLAKLINAADEKEMDKDKEQMANGSDMVEVDGEKMTVNALINMCGEYKKRKNEEDAEKEKENMSDEEKKKADEIKNKKKNEEDAEKEKVALENKKKNEEDAEKEKAKNALEAKKAEGDYFNKLKNARTDKSNDDTLILSADRVELGKQKYGSSN